MKKPIREILPIILLASLSVYLAVYLYDEIILGGVNAGVYLFFNLPLGIGQLLLSRDILKSAVRWQRIVSIIGIIIAILVLIPPFVYFH